MRSMTAPAPDELQPALSASVPFVDDTVRWLEKAVIGLNLCPFAKGVHAKQQIHYAVTQATHPSEVLQTLRHELQALVETPPHLRDTTLLILPRCSPHFLDFNDLVGGAEDLLEAMELDGVIQIASFHPQYQFAGTDADDVTNCTNRAPYPTLHLLREESIDRAVEAFPDAEAIFERNMQVLEGLGVKGWQALDVGAHDNAFSDPSRATATIASKATPL